MYKVWNKKEIVNYNDPGVIFKLDESKKAKWTRAINQFKKLDHPMG